MSVGFLIEVERNARLRRDQAGVALPAGRGVNAWLSSLLLRAHANRLLRRALRQVRPVRKTRIDELSPYILRDIGWPPG
jgi:hypothetical protein